MSLTSEVFIPALRTTVVPAGHEIHGSRIERKDKFTEIALTRINDSAKLNYLFDEKSLVAIYNYW